MYCSCSFFCKHTPCYQTYHVMQGNVKLRTDYFFLFVRYFSCNAQLQVLRLRSCQISWRLLQWKKDEIFLFVTMRQQAKNRVNPRTTNFYVRARVHTKFWVQKGLVKGWLFRSTLKFGSEGIRVSLWSELRRRKEDTVHGNDFLIF